MSAVRLTGKAERDLLDIALYIAADNPARAFSFVEELEDACNALAEQALRFATLDGFETMGYRRRPYGRYSIIYAPRDAEIIVLRILASSVNLQKSLFDD